jgi:hypothetical protein
MPLPISFREIDFGSRFSVMDVPFDLESGRYGDDVVDV